MNLNELRKKVIETIDSCYMVKDGEVYEFKIVVKPMGEKDISLIYDTNPRSFTVGFEKPNCKKVWEFNNARPFIDVIGIEDNGKLTLSDYSSDVSLPHVWISIKGDFFLTKENAESFKGC